MDYIIETDNLTKRYGTATVVDKVNLHVPKGKIYGLLGRNGAGKTTAVKLLCGLYYPTSGEILINGKSNRDFSGNSYFNLFSAVFLDYYFMPMTIAENICET